MRQGALRVCPCRRKEHGTCHPLKRLSQLKASQCDDHYQRLDRCTCRWSHDLGTQQEGATAVRHIGKSSDPNHPFHHCDDIDSDDAAIKAILDSASDDSHGNTLDFDPSDPNCDPFETHCSSPALPQSPFPAPRS
eukprot:4399469-Pleurochrysis_carterae.AAC.4